MSISPLKDYIIAQSEDLLTGLSSEDNSTEDLIKWVFWHKDKEYNCDIKTELDDKYPAIRFLAHSLYKAYKRSFIKIDGSYEETPLIFAPFAIETVEDGLVRTYTEGFYISWLIGPEYEYPKALRDYIIEQIKSTNFNVNIEEYNRQIKVVLSSHIILSMRELQIEVDRIFKDLNLNYSWASSECQDQTRFTIVVP